MKAYCVKCKSEKEIADAVEATLKNGRKAIKGKCPTCGTGVFKMVGGPIGKTAVPTKQALTRKTKTETAPRATPVSRLTFFG